MSCLSISPHLFVFRSIQEVPDPDKPESWRFFLFASWLGDRHVSLNAAERLKALKDRGSCLAEVGSRADPFAVSKANVVDVGVLAVQICDSFNPE